MIPANHASSLMPSQKEKKSDEIVREWIDKTEELIREAAINNRKNVRLYSVFGDSLIYKYVYDSKSDEEFDKFKKIVIDAGYELKDHVNFGQFADIDLIISWK